MVTMSNTIHALGSAGPGVPFYALDKEWSFSMVGPGIRGDFASWCRIHVQKQLESMRAEYTPQRFAEEQTALRRDIRAGYYSWGTPLETVDNEDGLAASSMGAGLQELMQSVVGQAALVRVMLKAKHGEVSFKDIDAMSKADPDGFQDAIREAMWLAPNLPTPEQMTALSSASSETQRQTMLNEVTNQYATELTESGQTLRQVWTTYRDWKHTLTAPTK